MNVIVLGSGVIGTSTACDLARNGARVTVRKTRYANAGRDPLGWTVACGSGKLVADLATDRHPDISTDGLSLDRYTRPAPPRMAPRLQGAHRSAA